MTYTVGFDTEFYNSSESNMNIVCAVFCFPDRVRKYWLLDSSDFKEFVADLKQIIKDKAEILAYAASAEARSLLSLNLEPFNYKWIDLYTEFRMLCNSNNKYKYGKYINKEGEKRFSTPPPYDMTEEEKKESKRHGADYTERPYNLVNALYSMLDVVVDTDQKIEMRDLILRHDNGMIMARKEEVLDYCLSDTQYLRALDLAIQKALQDEGLGDFRDNQLDRGNYSIATAKSEHLGMPLNMPLLDSIVKHTPRILEKYKVKVNEHFRFFLDKIESKPFTVKSGKNKGLVKKFKDKEAKKDMKAYQEFVKSLAIQNFPVTDTGKYKFDKQTLVDFRQYHPALREMLLYTEIENNLKWFNKENGNGFFERVGTDCNVRPYFGIFGTQTGRNAPSAKTFLLAQSSWLRAAIQPPKGEYIIGCDFSQQEVYVAAVLSGDQNLLEAYNSGDVYLAFAKQAGMVPQDATKATHKFERQLCKSLVLGIQYGMGKDKLCLKLCQESGTLVSMEKTLELLDAHKHTYVDYWRWVRQISEDYKNGNPLITNDGFVLFQDNPSIPSIRNFLVQGTGASILRRAIIWAWQRGLKVMCGLHDAIYIRTSRPLDDYKKLNKIMLEATASILAIPKSHCTMRIDTKVVGHSRPWVDEKGKQDWEDLKGFLI